MKETNLSDKLQQFEFGQLDVSPQTPAKLKLHRLSVRDLHILQISTVTCQCQILTAHRSLCFDRFNIYVRSHLMRMRMIFPPPLHTTPLFCTV